MYSILTDSLTLNGTGILDCYSDKKKSEWSDLLVNKFKKFRSVLLNQHNTEELSTSEKLEKNEFQLRIKIGYLSTVNLRFK